MPRENIEDLIAHLTVLRLEETNLIERIVTSYRQLQQETQDREIQREILQNNNNENNADERNNNELQIGDRVRILNPKRFQETTGIISKIGQNRVTITPRRGIKIVRHPNNVEKIPQT